MRSVASLSVVVLVVLLALAGCGPNRAPGIASATRNGLNLTVESLAGSQGALFASWVLTEKKRFIMQRTPEVSVTLNGHGPSGPVGAENFDHDNQLFVARMWSRTASSGKVVTLRAHVTVPNVAGNERITLADFTFDDLRIAEPLAVATNGHLTMTVAGFARWPTGLMAFLDVAPQPEGPRSFHMDVAETWGPARSSFDKRQRFSFQHDWRMGGNLWNMCNPLALNPKAMDWRNPTYSTVGMEFDAYEVREIPVSFARVPVAARDVTRKRGDVMVTYLGHQRQEPGGGWYLNFAVHPEAEVVGLRVLGVQPGTRSHTGFEERADFFSPHRYQAFAPALIGQNNTFSLDCVVKVKTRKLGKFRFPRLPAPKVW